MIIQTSPLIYLGIHAIIVEGPGGSGIGIIQYIWAYGRVHTFEVKGGGAIFLKVSQAIAVTAVLNMWKGRWKGGS